MFQVNRLFSRESSRTFLIFRLAFFRGFNLPLLFLIVFRKNNETTKPPHRLNVFIYQSNARNPINPNSNHQSILCPLIFQTMKSLLSASINLIIWRRRREKKKETGQWGIFVDSIQLYVKPLVSTFALIIKLLEFRVPNCVNSTKGTGKAKKIKQDKRQVSYLLRCIACMDFLYLLCSILFRTYLRILIYSFDCPNTVHRYIHSIVQLYR